MSFEVLDLDFDKQMFASTKVKSRATIFLLFQYNEFRIYVTQIRGFWRAMFVDIVLD